MRRFRLLRVLRRGTTTSRAEGVEPPQGARLQPPLWLLLAGIITIGIAIGLFAASITVMLLSSFGVRAADRAEVSALPHPPTLSASAPGLPVHETRRS